ncbi:phosphonatase-like hydrolase [Ktedonobacter racemifer]|uniref:Haloacid dehalogenase domain protein hydrolase n=1 Tax=Ktedonobacter racemifer DSM 44963 TaxID=485913 RepID=D6TDG2_KTERA|nr:phosphonatase-like hydrolase [Ktedonobacter racemifer]EFH88307.1 Haloacid dehalogenase domain protein hydrolase [Ktedonobacter racemifer DSM 44963]
MGSIQLVVFDMAGTTIDDSGNKVLTALVEAARIHDLPGTPDELNKLMGMNKREVFTLLAEQLLDRDSEQVSQLAEAALATFVERMRAAYSQNVKAIPGTEETFAFLRERGVKIALDTGFDSVIGGLILEQLGWLDGVVDCAIFSSDVSRGRPAPYMIFRAMEQLDVQDVRQVMKIGDSPADLDEGMNAGCGEVIGVLSGAHTAESLGRYRHTRLLPSVADLPALFNQ